MNDSDPPFERTRCACAQCVACCKRQPGALIPRDIPRIADHIAKTQNCDPEIALSRLKAQIWASPGSLVKNTTTGRTERIGTVTPRWDRRRKCCVFLTDDNKCSIHEVAPFGCAYYDTHMVAWHERSIWAVQQHMNPDYQQFRNELPMASHYKPFGNP
jgi:Fe-S-cluster containining protein